MSEIICPVCNYPTVPNGIEDIEDNIICPACYRHGSKKLWDSFISTKKKLDDLSDKNGKLETELDCTRKALDVAVDALKLISLRYLCEYADKALDQIKQITALEQKGCKMNDRFKFRVWNQKHNFYCNQLAEMCINYNGYCFDNGVSADYFEHDGFVIEQCTGLKDKNGNLIYEGDIIHEVDKDADIDDVSQIVWNQDTCHFMRLDLPDTKLNRHCLICEADSPYIEIIGNIHEQAEQKDK